MQEYTPHTFSGSLYLVGISCLSILNFISKQTVIQSFTTTSSSSTTTSIKWRLMLSLASIRMMMQSQMVSPKKRLGIVWIDSTSEMLLVPVVLHKVLPQHLYVHLLIVCRSTTIIHTTFIASLNQQG